MGFRLWSDGNPSQLNGRVRMALAQQYDVAPEAMERLRCVQKGGRYAGRQVHYIRVFDPAKITEPSLAAARYDDFQTGGSRTALLFEGHIEKDGIVCLTDRRPPLHAAAV